MVISGKPTELLTINHLLPSERFFELQMFEEFTKLIQAISFLTFVTSVHFVGMFTCTGRCVHCRAQQHIASTAGSGNQGLGLQPPRGPHVPGILQVVYLARSLLLSLYFCSVEFLASHVLPSILYLYHFTENTWKTLVNITRDVLPGKSTRHTSSLSSLVAWMHHERPHLFTSSSVHPLWVLSSPKQARLWLPAFKVQVFHRAVFCPFFC